MLESPEMLKKVLGPQIQVYKGVHVLDFFHDFRFSSRYVTNLLVILSSAQFTAPFSVVPRVMAFLCTVTNCRFSRCSSDRVMFRDGNMMCGLTVPEGLRLSRPPIPVCSANIVETMVVVVCSRICKASVGAFAACGY